MNTLQRKAEADANHKANLSASLKRRMEVARSNNDAGLLNVLEQEMKQLIGHAYFEKQEFAKALPYLEGYVNQTEKVRREDSKGSSRASRKAAAICWRARWSSVDGRLFQISNCEE